MLTAVAILGLAAFFTVSVIRRLPGVDRWTLSGVKPWACNLCMSVWTSLAWMLVTRAPGVFRGDYIASGLTWAATGGICLIMLEWSESLAPTGEAPPIGGPS